MTYNSGHLIVLVLSQYPTNKRWLNRKQLGQIGTHLWNLRQEKDRDGVLLLRGAYVFQYVTTIDTIVLQPNR